MFGSHMWSNAKQPIEKPIFNLNPINLALYQFRHYYRGPIQFRALRASSI